MLQAEEKEQIYKNLEQALSDLSQLFPDNLLDEPGQLLKQYTEIFTEFLAEEGLELTPQEPPCPSNVPKLYNT